MKTTALRTDDVMWEKFRKFASLDKRSANGQLNYLISRYVAEKEFEMQIPQTERR